MFDLNSSFLTDRLRPMVVLRLCRPDRKFDCLKLQGDWQVTSMAEATGRRKQNLF